MKKLIASLLLVTSFSAFSAEVSFTYFGNEGWGQSYYHCDYVESETEKVLEMFGASNVNVSCTGGIEFGHWSPVNVEASFDAPVLSGNEVAETVKYRGRQNESCGLNVAIVRNLLPKFSNVTVVEKRESCAFAGQRFSYVFSVLK